MSVSKKHMEWAASYLAANLSQEDTADAERSITVQAFVDFFKEFSPRFNSMRFFEAVRTRRANPRKKKKYYEYTDQDMGVHIDGTYGHDHAMQKMASMLGDVDSIRAGTLLEEYDDGSSSMDDEFQGEWLDDATEALQEVTDPKLSWEWDGGDLVLREAEED
jgi:hypothetical protein